jgi:hypothetical protein
MPDAKNINAHAELLDLMASLVMRGVPIADVIDAGFRLTITAVSKLYGNEAAGETLADMNEAVEACQEPERRVLH